MNGSPRGGALLTRPLRGRAAVSRSALGRAALGRAVAALVVACGMLLSGTAALAWTAEGGVVLTEPAVWGSLYQNHGPQAVHDRHRDVTYLAYFGPDRDLRVVAYDHGTGMRRGPVTVGENPRWDNPHSAPSIDVTPDGHIHIAWGSHSSAILHARSDVPGSITDGWSQQPIATDPSVSGSGGTYPLLVADPEAGTLAVVYRAGFWHDGPGAWSHEYGLMQISRDGGETWSEPQVVGDSTASYPHSDFYPSAATWHDGALHLTWTLAQGTDARPHDVVRADIFHASYDADRAAWSSLGGVDLGPWMDWDDMYRHARAIRQHGTGAARHHVGPEGVVLVAAVDNHRTAGAELFVAPHDAAGDADWDARNWSVHRTGIEVHDRHTAHHLLPDGSGGWLAYVSAPSSMVRYRLPDGPHGDWELEETIARSSHANPSGDRMVRSTQVRHGGPIDVFVQDGGWGWYGGSGWSAREVARSRSPITAVARPGRLDPGWAHWNALHPAHRWWYFGEPYTGLGVRQEGDVVRLKGFVAGDPVTAPSASDPAPIAELAPAHRPAERHVFEAYDDDRSPRGRVDVRPDGWVVAARGDVLSLDGLSFTTGDAVGAWEPATLEPGWSRFQPGSDLTSPASTRTDGEVRLKGFVSGAARDGGPRIFRLPPDRRPEHRQVFAVYATGAHLARVDVHPDGWVEHVEGGENLSLDGISFRVDAAWTAPTLGAGWSELGRDLTPAGYTHDPEQGRVHLRGFVRGPGPGSTIFRLPAGLRPAERQILDVYRTGVPDAAARVDVLPNGDVRHVRGGDWLSLDGVSFALDR